MTPLFRALIFYVKARYLYTATNGSSQGKQNQKQEGYYYLLSPLFFTAHIAVFIELPGKDHYFHVAPLYDKHEQ